MNALEAAVKAIKEETTFRQLGFKKWNDPDHLTLSNLNSRIGNYEVKPKLKEYWCNEYKNGIGSSMHKSLKLAESSALPHIIRTIHFREVPPEENEHVDCGSKAGVKEKIVKGDWVYSQRYGFIGIADRKSESGEWISTSDLCLGWNNHAFKNHIAKKLYPQLQTLLNQLIKEK